MNRKLLALFLCAALLCSIVSCVPNATGSDNNSEVSAMNDKQVNLSLDTFYGFSFTDALEVKNDNGKVLTNGETASILCKVKDVPLTHGDWFGGSHTTSLFAEKEGSYYLKNDFGFIVSLEKSSLSFGKDKDIPERVELFYSDDGYNFNLYAGEMEKSEIDGNVVFSIEPVEPIKAKAVKYYIFSPVGTTNNIVGIENLGVRQNERVLLSEGCSYTHDGIESAAANNKDEEKKKLTDGVFGSYKETDSNYALFKSTKNDTLTTLPVICFDIDLKDVSNVSEVHLSSFAGTGAAKEIDFISVKYEDAEGNFKDFCTAFAESKNGGSFAKKVRFSAMRNHTVQTKKLRVLVFASTFVAIDEIEVYGSEKAVTEPEYQFRPIHETNKPVIAGGFYGFFINYIQGYNKHHFFDEYRIYLLLKGWRELGMEYIVAPNNLDYNAKQILIEPSKELAEKGYKKTSGQGVTDVNKAILSVCDKLGMKVFVSTLSSTTYPDIPGTHNDKIKFYEEVAEDAELLIPLLNEKYASHKSFYGYYLTDETCDYWMMADGGKGTDAYRVLYGSQSSIIRSVNQNAEIMIAPAAWRSDTPKNFASNMKKLISADNSSGKPIITIVAMQDCLGREPTLKVPDEVYTKFESYLSEVSKEVPEAGSRFFSDAEVFDVGYKGKRFDEIIKSLELEDDYSESIIVYDLPHYFSAQGRGSFDSYMYFDYDYIISSYAKYLNQID